MGHKFTALIQFESGKAVISDKHARKSAKIILQNWLEGRGLPDWVEITKAGISDIDTVYLKKKPKPQKQGVSREIVGLAEVAEMANVTPAAVSNWRRRKSYFPPPMKELAQGPIWLRAEMEGFLQEFDLINYKKRKQ